MIPHENYHFYGYVFEKESIETLIYDEERKRLQNERKLPLILDIDDTLLRIVSDKNEECVIHPKDLHHYPQNRIHKLSNGVTVVLAKNFLLEISSF